MRKLLSSKNLLWAFAWMPLAATVAFTVTGCRSDRNAESAGENIDEAWNDAKRAAEDATD